MKFPISVWGAVWATSQPLETGCEAFPTVNERYCQLVCSVQSQVANVAHCEREILSVILFSFVGMCWALFVMLCCKVRRTSFLTMFISLVDLDINVFLTCTTPMLSIWKIMRLFDNHVCHKRSETYTGNSSKNVMSRITSKITQCVGHFE